MRDKTKKSFVEESAKLAKLKEIIDSVVIGRGSDLEKKSKKSKKSSIVVFSSYVKILKILHEELSAEK